MVGRSTLGLAAPLSVSAFASIVLIHSASAATHEQIVERCRESARPQVHACVMGKRGTGDRESNLAACRASIGRPMVTACVLREEQRLAKGKPPPAAPKINTTMGLHRCRLRRLSDFISRRGGGKVALIAGRSVPQQRKARPSQDCRAQGSSRRGATGHYVSRQTCAVLLRSGYCACVASPQQGSASRRSASDHGR